MTGFDLNSFPILTTERLILREVVAEDAEDVLAFRGDAEVQQYNLVPMRDTREALGLVRTMRGWYASGYAIQWGITLRDDGHVLGLCGLHDWSRHRRRAALGYDLVRSHWGRGIAGEATRAVLRFGFEGLDLEQFYALTATENARSIRVLQRLGFQFERVRPDNPWENDGRFRERAVYRLNRADYLAGRSAPAADQG